ncbi:MAG: hypothetical protein V4613_11550 [Bacteroidota bacterium]
MNLRKKTENKETFKATKAIKKQKPANILSQEASTDSNQTEKADDITVSENDKKSDNYIVNNKLKHASLPSNIGQDTTQPQKPAKPPYEKNSKNAVIFFLISIPLMLVGLGFFLFIASIALAIVGRKKILRSDTPLRGLTMDNVIIILAIIVLGAFILGGMLLLLYIISL